MSGARFNEAAAPEVATRAAERAFYLDTCLRARDCNEANLARALLLIAERDGMCGIARECGVSAVTLRRQLNGTRPLYFDTVVGVMRALGVRLRVEVA